MNPVKATLIYITTMASLLIIWFYVIRHFKEVIQFMATVVNKAEVNTVSQNQVTMFNILFVFMLLAFTGWYLYVLHSRERETTYLDLGGRRGFFR